MSRGHAPSRSRSAAPRARISRSQPTASRSRAACRGPPLPRSAQPDRQQRLPIQLPRHHMCAQLPPMRRQRARRQRGRQRITAAPERVEQVRRRRISAAGTQHDCRQEALPWRAVARYRVCRPGVRAEREGRQRFFVHSTFLARSTDKNVLHAVGGRGKIRQQLDFRRQQRRIPAGAAGEQPGPLPSARHSREEPRVCVRPIRPQHHRSGRASPHRYCQHFLWQRNAEELRADPSPRESRRERVHRHVVPFVGHAREKDRPLVARLVEDRRCAH